MKELILQVGADTNVEYYSQQVNTITSHVDRIATARGVCEHSHRHPWVPASYEVGQWGQAVAIGPRSPM